MEQLRYLRNRNTGVVFMATPQLIKEREQLGLIAATEAEYNGLSAKPAAEASTEVVPLDGTRLTILVNAIAQLDGANPEHFNKDGLPNARALEAITGTRVIKAERNEAWEVYQSEEG